MCDWMIWFVEAGNVSHMKEKRVLENQITYKEELKHVQVLAMDY